MTTVTNFRHRSTRPAAVLYDQDRDTPDEGGVRLDVPLVHRLHRYLTATRAYHGGDLVQFDADLAHVERALHAGGAR